MDVKALSVDEALELTGGFGRFQWRLIAMMSYCMAMLALQGLQMTFTANDPGWRCAANSSQCNFTHVQKPGMEAYKFRCHMDSDQWTFHLSHTSIVTQFQLYCDRSIFKNIATSFVYLGWFLGAILFGVMSDKFGRKKALFASMIVMSAAGVLSSFSTGVWMFSALKILVGAGIGGSMTSIFILNTEFAGPKKRGFSGILVWNFWVVGLSLLALLAYFIRDWQYLNIAASAPGLLILCFYWKIPESIRWLLVHGKTEEARKILKKVALVNTNMSTDGLILESVSTDGLILESVSTDGLILESDTCKTESGNFVIFIRHAKLAKNTLVSILTWFTCSMTYYGISLSAGHLGGNIYLVFFLTSIVTVPANIAAIWLVDRFGRRKSLRYSLAISAIAMFCTVLFPSGNTNQGFVAGRIVTAMCAKFMVTIAFDAVYLITYEIYPTTLRNLGMGLSSAGARLGSFCASFIIHLVEIHSIMPYVLFGSVATICLIASAVLPETNNTATKEHYNASRQEFGEMEALQKT